MKWGANTRIKHRNTTGHWKHIALDYCDDWPFREWSFSESAVEQMS